MNTTSTTPSDCDVFIQIWVDGNATQLGQTTGIYLVDNGGKPGTEGGTGLNTVCTTGSLICWTVMPVDPNFVAKGGSLQLQSVGNSSAWGDSGQPNEFDSLNFIGTAETVGSASYQVTINVCAPGGSGMTLFVNPAITVN